MLKDLISDPLINQVIGLIVSGGVSFGVKSLRDLSKSVSSLNKNIELILLQISGHEKKLDDHEGRLRGVEKKVRP